MSIRSRIVLTVTAVFAVISLLAGWLMLNRAERSLKTAFDRAIQTRAEWLLSLVSVDPVILPLPTATQQMQVVYRTYGRDRVLFRSPDFPDESVKARPDSVANLSYRSITTQTTPDQLPDGKVTLTLAVPDRSLHQDINQLRWVFGLGWLLSLAIALAAGYGAAGWLLRPLQVIISQANAISRVVSKSRISLPETHDELYQLSDTLNRMLARIQENAELQQNFFGAAAHELRTPLTVLKTGLDVTLSGNDMDTTMHAFLIGQRDEVSRLARLIDEFLTLSRPEESTQPLSLTPVNIPSLVSTCLNQLATVAADYDVTTQLDDDATIQPTIMTDATKLEHILLNLIENAIKYAVPGSTVRVQLRGTAQWVIRVQNQTVRPDGPTLDLLQPYFQADPLREGHGLGLWISARLTNLIEGELRLEWREYTFTSELSLPHSTFRI